MSVNKLEEKVDPAVAQIYYQEQSDDYYQILYVDDQVVLLRCDDEGRSTGNVHRIERRAGFEEQVESGWFEYQPDSDLDMMDFTEEDWSEVDHIGKKTASNLHDAGYKTSLEIIQAEDDELLAVDGLGAMGLVNIRSYVK